MKNIKIFENEDYTICVNQGLKYDFVKAVGANILVELLTVEEVFDSTIKIPNSTKLTAIQAIILDIGPGLKAEEWGITIGDRVVLWGDYVPVPRPKNDKNKRELGIYAAHSIKAVLKKNES
jgi:co-chaperonin GroES (HSP10)